MVLGGQMLGSIDILDGTKVAALTSPANATVVADVHIPLPSGWSASTSAARSPIRDINNDTYPDFAIGHVFGSAPGRVSLFW